MSSATDEDEEVRELNKFQPFEEEVQRLVATGSWNEAEYQRICQGARAIMTQEELDNVGDILEFAYSWAEPGWKELPAK